MKSGSEFMLQNNAVLTSKDRNSSSLVSVFIWFWQASFVSLDRDDCGNEEVKAELK